MTIFSKIIAKQIPCYKIFETDLSFAFLDIYPHNLGHTLVVPKVEVGDFLDLPPEYLADIFQTAQAVGRAIKKATNSKRVGLAVHGMGVPDHFHLHVVPMFTPFDLDQNKAHQESEEKMQEIQKQIVSFLH